MQSFDQIPLILASASPRRLDLLGRFWRKEAIHVMVPVFDESRFKIELDDVTEHDQEDGRLLAQRLAQGKMDALLDQFALPSDYVALAADTMIVLDDRVLGKPKDRKDALDMLRLLSGRTHQVITGLCLTASSRDNKVCFTASEVTDVLFAPLADRQIKWYVDSGEPMDKAGAYAIQGLGATLVRKIDGCYYNVMGLPVGRLMALLRHVTGHFSSNPLFQHLLPWD
ncbi:MAG: Maf family protein [Saccharofermentanales bacterium]|jgi:septum formation protein|nr:septum formation protein Maf [Clostridiaceae bacterium]